MSFSLGIAIAAGRIGSSANTFITPRLYEQNPNDETDNSIGIPLLVGGVISLIALVSTIVLFIIDKRAEMHDKEIGAYEEKKVKPSLKNL